MIALTSVAILGWCATANELTDYDETQSAA